MRSNQSIILAVLAIVAGVFLSRAMLWRLFRSTTGFAPRLLSYAIAWPVWLRAAPLWTQLQAGYPKPYAVLASRCSTASFTGFPLTLMCLAALYTAALLMGLADDLRETEGLIRIDGGVNAFFAPFRAPWLVQAFVWITALGAGPAITAVVVTATALLWSQRRTRVIPPLWITFVGAQGTTWAGKYAIGRTRPIFLDVASAASPSFPSGHATASTALVGFLAYVIARELPGSRQRFEVVFWTAVIIGLICFSRLFLSLHYLSDIAAGLLVGVFWLVVGFTVAELNRAAAP